ncbi:MAG TPA: hypothetical protein VKE41_12770 [Roseiflexaceae bacterium]|nr:hypothetical protein [Roseiflexaceae bacterium]
MDFDSMPATSISIDARSRVSATQTRYVVAADAQELTSAQLWVRTLAGDQEASAVLLARIMPQPRND